MVITATHPPIYPFMPNSNDSQLIQASGFASITGVIGLANPRILPGTKTIVLDAQIYLGEGVDGPRFLIGSLRYFNSDNLTFDDSAQLYSIYSTVSHLALILASARTHTAYLSLLADTLPLRCILPQTSAPMITLSLVTSSG